MTKQIVSKLMAAGTLKRVDVEAAARLLNGAALNAALRVAASDQPHPVLPKAIEAFRVMAEGLRAESAASGSTRPLRGTDTGKADLDRKSVV